MQIGFAFTLIIDDLWNPLAAFKGNGAGDSIDRANILDSTETAMYVEFWFKMDGNPALGIFLACQATGAGDANTDFRVLMNPDSTIQFVMFTSGASYTFSTASTTYSDDAWHHCFCTGAGGTIDSVVLLAFLASVVSGLVLGDAIFSFLSPALFCNSDMVKCNGESSC